MAIKFSQFTEKVDSANIDGLVGYFGNQNIKISPSDLVGTTTLNASNITTGTLADARLSSNVALKDVDNNFSVGQTIGGDTIINGNVGIGTTDIEETLTIAKTDGGDGTITGFRSDAGFSQFEIETKESQLSWGFNAISSRNIYFTTNGIERMRIDSSGNVGIGTTAPSEKLDVNGNVTISGSLSKGSGSFKIDHPLPEKKDTHHLVHSFVEAPQADNIYRGKIDLVDGKATVNLDQAGRVTEGTFVLLNGNIQCFTSNESGWTAIRGKVQGNILTIEAQDSECTDIISWLVIGERIDQHMINTSWTDENGRVVTEPLKKVEPTTNEEITE